MLLNLAPHFSFAEFRRQCPLNADSVFELIQLRHAHRMTVKRAGSTTDNLRKIITATFRIANTRGFAAMSLRDLSRESGLSMGGLYGYIKSKDDLAAMIEDVVRHSSTVIPEWFAAWPSSAARLEATLRGHIFLSELLHPWFFFVFMDSRVLSKSQKSVAKAADLHFQQELSRLAQATKAMTASEADLFASHCLALIQDWYVKRWKYTQLRINVDTFADSLCLMVLGAR